MTGPSKHPRSDVCYGAEFGRFRYRWSKFRQFQRVLCLC